MNIGKHFGALVSKFFQRLVYATSEARYEEALGILEKDYPNGKEAVAYIRAIDPRKFSICSCIIETAAEESIDLLTEYAKGRLSEFEREYGSQAILPITEQVLASHITCRAPEAAVRKGRARIVRIPNGGGTSRRHREYMYPKRDEPRLISSQGPLTATSEEATGLSTQHGRGKSSCRQVITEGELEGPSSSQRVHDPDESFLIQRSVLESQQKTCEDLTDRLVEAGATVAGLEAELKQKDLEIAILKERLQDSKQKLQQMEVRNAWLNEVTGTLRSEIQTLRSESMKRKLTGKLPNRDWVHEAKQRWKVNSLAENMRRLSEALEKHEDQIVVREKMFLKHVRYLTVTYGDEEAPPDLSRAAVILCRRNDVLYTSAERQQQLEAPFTSFPDWKSQCHLRAVR
ncbi:hypothetical protein R1flu_009795 [Riccia fluitans]|uniref:Uncharacterized protein n=1 Tax=Riccia fluitans TaxID=41844 RepID=A0ABD1Z352_9MARC